MGQKMIEAAEELRRLKPIPDLLFDLFRAFPRNLLLSYFCATLFLGGFLALWLTQAGTKSFLAQAPLFETLLPVLRVPVCRSVCPSVHLSICRSVYASLWASLYVTCSLDLDLSLSLSLSRSL